MPCACSLHTNSRICSNVIEQQRHSENHLLPMWLIYSRVPVTETRRDHHTHTHKNEKRRPTTVERERKEMTSQMTGCADYLDASPPIYIIEPHSKLNLVPLGVVHRSTYSLCVCSNNSKKENPEPQGWTLASFPSFDTCNGFFSDFTQKDIVSSSSSSSSLSPPPSSSSSLYHNAKRYALLFFLFYSDDLVVFFSFNSSQKKIGWCQMIFKNTRVLTLISN